MTAILSTLEQGKFVIQEIQGMKGLFAHQDFSEGEILFKVEGELMSKPTRTSVQVDVNKHIDVDAPAKFINHSCFGNVALQELKFVAIRAIQKGEEITFDYNSNEENMSDPFPCRDCGQMIKGKNYLANYPCGRKN